LIYQSLVGFPIVLLTLYIYIYVYVYIYICEYDCISK
jgi:hypothetical protein